MKKIIPYIFLFPAISLLLVFIIVPMCQVVYYSFFRYSFFSTNEFIGFNNYLRLWNDSNFWWTLGNSLAYIIVTPILIIVSMVLALSVRNTLRHTKLLRLFFFLPVVTPIIIVGIMWKWIFTEEIGLLNYLLSVFGIEKILWLTHYPTNMVSVMILTIWRGFGYYMMIILSGLAALPKEIEEASILDGANYFQQIVYIILPNLKPTLLFIFVVSSASAIKLFTEIYVLIPGVPMYNKTLVSYLYRQSFERFDFGYGAALAVVVFIITSIFSYLNVRIMERA